MASQIRIGSPTLEDYFSEILAYFKYSGEICYEVAHKKIIVLSCSDASNLLIINILCNCISCKYLEI